MYNLTRYCVQKVLREFLKQDKRFAGHSKWQNIKHIKAENDQEKNLLHLSLVRRMKVAIAEGGSMNPAENAKLSAVLDEARRRNMPNASVTAFFEKLEKSKIKTQTALLDFRGPGGAIFLLKLLTDNVVGTRMFLNQIFKKQSCAVAEGKLLSAFKHHGFVITEHKDNLDAATDDAIVIGAEEVEEIEDKYYRFVCHPYMVPKVVTQLEKINYNIITADEEFIPRAMTRLSDADLQKVDILQTKLNAVNEVVMITHNIEMPEEEEEEKGMKSEG